MLETELDGRLQVAELVAAIVALALELERIDGLALHEPRDAVGELDLAARALADLREVVEQGAGQEIAPDHGEGGRRLVGLGLLDDVDDLAHALDDRFLQGHDAVLVGIALRHVLYAEHAAAALLVDHRHLLQARHRRIDQVVGEMHHEGRVADHRPRAQHRVAETERRGLAYVHAGSPARQDAVQGLEQLLLALLLQHGLELRVAVEMILDGALRASGDEHQRVSAR